jgi:tRNA (cytidine/uridine-2'-O-)-methyltransferase
LEYHDSFDELVAKYPDARFFFATTKASKVYTEIAYNDGDFLVFGKETKGLSMDILNRYPDSWIRMPMGEEVRSLNLSNAAAVILYEGLRQVGFPGLK